ncbi:hypothetical protein MCEMIE11_00289 [Burkholderiales bacterium]
MVIILTNCIIDCWCNASEMRFNQRYKFLLWGFVLL